MRITKCYFSSNYLVYVPIVHSNRVHPFLPTANVCLIKELIAYSINYLLRQKNNCQIIVIWLKAYAIFSICCFTNIVASV